MWRTIIVDDEAKGRQSLIKMLQLLHAPVEIVAEAASVETAVALIDSHKPQLVFLDIQLQKGTGFDVLEQLQFKDFQLIFVTAYDQYALKAFRYAAMDYLTKPIDPDQLQEALQRLPAKETPTYNSEKIHALQANKNELHRLALNDAQGIQLVKVQDIIYCSAQNNYTEFHLKDGQKHLVSKTLKEYEELLSEAGFFRVHQSYLINLEEVSQYLKQDGGYVQMSDGSLIGVSRRKKEELLRHFTQ